MRIYTLQSSALQACREQVISASHYRDDLSCRCAPGLKIEIENVYADGHRSSSVVELKVPEVVDDEWWEEDVHPLTGDGHGLPENNLGRTMEACYTATITAAPDPALVGLQYEWVG